MPSWHEDTACRDKDPDFFFLDRGRSATVAKIICSECAVLTDCLEWALSQPETPFGVWGGLSYRELVVESKRRSGL